MLRRNVNPAQPKSCAASGGRWFWLVQRACDDCLAHNLCAQPSENHDTRTHDTHSTLGDRDPRKHINAIHSASQTLRHYKYNTITVSASILKIHCVSLTNLVCQTRRHYPHNSFHVISRIRNSRTTPAIHLGCQTLRHYKYSDLAVSDAHALRL